MRKAGRIVAGTIDAVLAAVAPGRSTLDLDRVAERYIRGQGAIPSFKGYRGTFPASICASRHCGHCCGQGVSGVVCSCWAPSAEPSVWRSQIARRPLPCGSPSSMRRWRPQVIASSKPKACCHDKPGGPSRSVGWQRPRWRRFCLYPLRVSRGCIYCRPSTVASIASQTRSTPAGRVREAPGTRTGAVGRIAAPTSTMATSRHPHPVAGSARRTPRSRIRRWPVTTSAPNTWPSRRSASRPPLRSTWQRPPRPERRVRPYPSDVAAIRLRLYRRHLNCSKFQIWSAVRRD
jgi:hypothetical protein